MNTPVVMFKETEETKEPERMPSLTWKIANGRMNELIDGIDAAKQAVWKRLNTEAEVYDIYSPEYGLKTVDLIGKEINYGMSMLKQRIADTILRDDRMTSVSNFSQSEDKRKVKLTFTVGSIFGEFDMEQEVQL